MIESRPGSWFARGAALFVLLGASLGSLAAPVAAQDDALKMATFEKVWTTVRDRHWDPELGGVDWDAIHDEFEPKVRAAESDVELRNLLNDMIGRLGQSHFGVFAGSDDHDETPPVGDTSVDDEDDETDENPDDVEEDDEDVELGSGDGFPGFIVRIVDEGVFVTHIIPDGPADRAGVRLGWEIVRYAGKDVSSWLQRRRGRKGEKISDDIFSVAVITSRMQGPVGKTIPVEFRLPGEPTTERVPVTIKVPGPDGSRIEKTVQVTRPARTDGPTVTKKIELTEPPGREYSMGHLTDMRVYHEARMIGDVGYFAFNAFFDPATIIPAFGKAMTEAFAKADGVIIDVRGNLGGIGFMANGMAGFFVEDSGLNLGTMMQRDSELKFVVNPRADVYEGPVAVLIDGASASTSEIFSGGLKDLGRVRIFGTRTAGMALPSVIEELPNGDRFQFAIADCMTPDGHKLEGVGVAPHVEAPHTRESLARGRDAALSAAIEWIESRNERKVKP